MDLRAFFVLLPMYFSLLNCYGVRGWEFSINEGVQIRNQLEFLNKPGVEIIQTIHGDNYICVDFYKQPAFEHPLLKNHSFHYQMEPSSYPEGIRMEESSQNIGFSNIWSNGRGCPTGTVPIRKMTKDEITKAYRISKMFQSPTHELTPSEPGIHFAGLRTLANANKRYNGAGVDLGIYAPKVAALQFSGSQLKIQGGSDYIQVGWMVNPNLYPDSLTRMFIFTHTNRFNCFNNLCPGFILVRPDLPVDSILLVSDGKKPKSLPFFIYKDVVSGNWWLTAGENKTQIGFWPKSLFIGLSDFATDIKWGGEVYSPTGIPSPQMGNGSPKRGNVFTDSICYNVVTVDENQEIHNAQDVEVFSDNFSVYKVYEKNNGGPLGHMFFYGGEGGLTGN